MTTNIETLNNLTTIEEFADRIRENVESSTRSWIDIANAFGEAMEMYGGDSDSFKLLCKQTHFHKSTAYKLAKVARCERLKKYADKLIAVHSWGTLYSISALSDKKFDILKAKFELDDQSAIAPFIRQSDITGLNRGKIERDSYKSFATIYIDEDAMKGMLFEGEHFEDLRAALTTIQNTIPYLKVVTQELEEKIESKYQAEFMREMERVERRAYKDAIDKFISGKLRKNSIIKKKDAYAQYLPYPSLEEQWSAFDKQGLAEMGMDCDRAELFNSLDAEYDQSKYFNEAVVIINQKREKVAEKLRFGTDEFKDVPRLIKVESEEPGLEPWETNQSEIEANAA
jgi:hypothetical protein